MLITVACVVSSLMGFVLGYMSTSKDTYVAGFYDGYAKARNLFGPKIVNQTFDEYRRNGMKYYFDKFQ